MQLDWQGPWCASCIVTHLGPCVVILLGLGMSPSWSRHCHRVVEGCGGLAVSACAALAAGAVAPSFFCLTHCGLVLFLLFGVQELYAQIEGAICPHRRGYLPRWKGLYAQMEGAICPE